MGKSENDTRNAQAKGRFPFSKARHAVQVCVLALFMVPVIVAGWSLFGLTAGGEDAIGTPATLPFFGTLSSSTVFGISLLDPFAVLQCIVAAKAFDVSWLVGLLPLLIVYALIRGRVFCGWVCPVNLVLEILDWLRRKLHIDVSETVLPRHVKVYVAAGVLVLSAVLSIPVFEALSPIGFINKGIVFGSMAGGLTLVAVVLVELFWGHRVWCRSLCPLGGFYEVVGKAGLVNVKIDHEACIGCNACKRSCLCDPEILDDAVAGDADTVSAGDCMLCGKCIEACPARALSLTVGRR